MNRQKWDKTEIGVQRKLAQVSSSRRMAKYFSKRTVPIIETDNELIEWVRWDMKRMKERKESK